MPGPTPRASIQGPAQGHMPPSMAILDTLLTHLGQAVSFLSTYNLSHLLRWEHGTWCFDPQGFQYCC